MTFDRARNSSELQELFYYLICIGLAYLFAGAIGMSWVTASVVALFAFRRWKMKAQALSPRLKVLLVLACSGFVIHQNWPAFCNGYAEGRRLAAGTLEPTANPSTEPAAPNRAGSS